VTEFCEIALRHPSRLPDFVEPMKAKLVASMPSGGGCVYEIKFDGYRTLANAGSSGIRGERRGDHKIRHQLLEIAAVRILLVMKRS
jgi:ATP-dependent DNA ligase